MIGFLGCATNNWSEPLFSDKNIRQQAAQTSDDAEVTMSFRQQWQTFWNSGFGSMSGSDSTAREIEKSLGF